ncbi:alpha/beta hydrolase [Roseimaritima ulvae]|uniref:Alpha/beta hydrolase family protein n=1 Tax=Roseimaritima ulvae TaxID=980254 RepID=A0A5B9QT59_9BACT|nr:alpha/beta hydrolase [Roseimaritima ulvae]QEG42198.1 hypothetical protein UC8_42320 [Roseimaritima ulvae]
MERVSCLPRRFTAWRPHTSLLLVCVSLVLSGCGGKEAAPEPAETVPAETTPAETAAVEDSAYVPAETIRVPADTARADAAAAPVDGLQMPIQTSAASQQAMSVRSEAMSVRSQAMAVRSESMAVRSEATTAAPQAMVAPQNARVPQMEVAAASASPAPQAMEPPMATLPAGTQVRPGDGFATVQVFYATDRQRGSLPLSAIEVTGQQQTVLLLAGCAVLLLLAAAVQGLRGRTTSAATAAMLAGLSGCAGVALLASGQTNIEKHGVTYGGDRGTLARGVCEVTVPNSHQRGQVERPSLLRFEIHEDQQKHIVLTSATELSEGDFMQRLSGTVAASPDQDMLVFIHGYNVDFESAVQRTAQIAIDLPFEGVPVCYSWPSQGSLVGYTIDENNVAWTVTHLQSFLLELAEESGAKSINVVAHSMGNRAMTAALQQLHWQRPEQSSPLFDRVVLAAPDVDADRFRRDLAPALLDIANQVTLYASSDDQALQASKQVHGYPRAGDGGDNIVVVPGVETIDVSGIDLSLLGHSYYGDNESMLRELYEVIRARLPAPQRNQLISRQSMAGIYWQLAQQPAAGNLR